MARAIERRGDSAVTTRDEDADPIFRLLRSARGGIITANTASNKGGLFEVLVGWHIIRQVIMEKGGPPTLEKTLRSLLPANFIFPEALRPYCVHTTHAEQSLSVEDFCSIVATRDDILHTNIDVLAGADLAFCVRDDMGRRALVLLQVKARQVTSFQDCLRSATPAWQFLDRHQRAMLASGEWRAGRGVSDRRRTFAALSQAQPTLLSSAVRIAVSLTGYKEHTLELCVRMNNHEEIGRSPVLPCCASTEAFGERMYEAFGHEGMVVSHPSDAFMFVPFSVEDVDAALASREGLKAFRRRYKTILRDASTILRKVNDNMEGRRSIRRGIMSLFKRSRVLLERPTDIKIQATAPC